ncbi:hypothetical protein CC117_29160 [Parafrankia colletiae]|uniref:Transposase n=1 Tax=Parafrankia colletiae TaxID=573497 RepID=A0A1S1QB52_9ACTN|nr:hypothetical protein CC117_29160 [Parafrankia colletiae]
MFTQVLGVCAKAGLGRLGTIAVDGTKIAANASKKATCRRQWLQRQVGEIIALASAEDAAEDYATASGGAADESSQRSWGRRDRAERLKRALAELVAEKTSVDWTPIPRPRNTACSSTPPGLGATTWGPTRPAQIRWRSPRLGCRPPSMWEPGVRSPRLPDRS